jgi:uncharacterized protein YjiS (DUF1127 family)
MIKKIFSNIMKRIVYVRMLQVFNSMDDRQLKDIGLSRSQIMEAARRSANL